MTKKQLKEIELFIGAIKQLPKDKADMYYIDISMNNCIIISIKPNKFSEKSLAVIIIDGSKKELFECIKLIKRYLNNTYDVEESILKKTNNNIAHFIKTKRYAFCFKTPKTFSILDILEQHNDAAINKNKTLLKK